MEEFRDDVIRIYKNFPPGDWRTRELLLMSSFLNIAGLLGLYLILVYWVGPSLMSKFQEPLDTYSYLVWHNLFLVFTNTVFGFSLLGLMIYGGQNVFCEPVGGDEPVSTAIAYIMYALLLLKIFELGDAFALICKQMDPPFILIFHHTTIVAVVWVSVKYGPGGSATFPTLVNSLVHVLIYLHFKFGRMWLSHMQSRKTFIMIYFVQFAIVSVLSSTTIYFNCGYPVWVAAICLLYNIILMLVYLKSMWSLWCAPSASLEQVSSSSSSSDNEEETNNNRSAPTPPPPRRTSSVALSRSRSNFNVNSDTCPKKEN